MRAHALIATVVATLASGISVVEAQTAGGMPDTLTTAERAIATRVVSEMPAARADTLPAYLVEIELVRDKQDPANRRALVTHYRYTGDVAVLTLVDLAEERIIQTDSIPNVPVPLSEREFEEARDLALSNEAVRAAIGDRLGDVVVEPLVTRTADPADPLFGHRAVRLLFRFGRAYLDNPVVTVDLTTRQVLIGG